MSSSPQVGNQVEQKKKEECFDVLNSDGSLSGRSKPRSEVHRHGDWHRAVHIWILDVAHAQVLMQKRAACKESHPLDWDISCAGHVSAGDDSITTAQRELEEELGIKAEKKDLELLTTLPIQYERKGDTYIDNEWSDVYILDQTVALDDMKLQDDEVESVKYFPINELQAILQQKTDGFVGFWVNGYEKVFDRMRAKISATGHTLPAATAQSIHAVLRSANTAPRYPSETARNQALMRAAYQQALKSFNERGVPVGAVLADQAGTILSRGHNEYVQSQDLTAHAETMCLRRAGLRHDMDKLILVTTLSPCIMCSATAAYLRLSHILVGDHESVQFKSEQFLKDRNIQAVDVTYAACSKLLQRFRNEQPELWRKLQETMGS